MKCDMCAQWEHRVINNNKGRMQEPIASKEDAITFVSAIRSDRG